MESSSNFYPAVKRHIYNNNPSTAATAAPPFKRPQPPLYIPHGQVAFRLLCHASRIGGLIGVSGSIIKKIQQLTNSKIRVDDSPNSVDHRVITVIGSPLVSKRIKVSVANELKGEVEGEENGGDWVTGAGDDWFDASAAQEGMLRVFERVVEVAAEGDSAAAIAGIVSCRLLAGKHQVGAIIGIGGTIVEKIRGDTGCRIRVLTLEKLPSGQFPTEEIVEIEGDLLGVKKALIAVTGRLHEFPPPAVDPTLGHSPVLQPISSNSITNSFNNGFKALDSDTLSNPDFAKRQQDVFFKILCPNALVGSIIGKGGLIIKTINKESGATINIGPVVSECSERLITIHAMENVDSQYSAVQHAAVLVFNRFVDPGSVMGLDSDSKGSQVLARVVVPSNQVGCLLGKGGSIISEMRKATHTGLKIIGGDQVPKCVSENVEILQITGEFANVRNAIKMVAGRLRENILFLQTSNGSLNCDPLKIENSNHSRLRDPPAFRLHQPLDTSNNLNDLTHRMDYLGISDNINQSSSHSLLASTAVSGVNAGNAVDIGRRLLPLPISRGGVKLSRSAIVTNTTVEIAVPDNIIGSILGENGSNLVRLRQISGAKVTVHEPQPGTATRMVVISGSADENQAAQSLLQAFIFSGSS